MNPSTYSHETTEERVDIREKGAPVEGVPQVSDKRLYCQLQVFTGCRDPKLVQELFQRSGLEGVIYLNMNDPYGIGILVLTENPADFVEKTRNLYTSKPLIDFTHQPEMTMIGRSYSTGHEPDLEDWLLRQPRRRALNPEWPWAIWYPLRRRGEFELLAKADQGKIIMEHAIIGKSYGRSGYVQDIRLACQGLDKNDNDFLLGLVSRELFPLSRIVQEMRKTQQTAKYLESLGPFFVGKVFWQSPAPSK
ncbi:MAG: chlorite dismutase family protein [Candidatus Omnitrophica bacterium]|nr:chlorite dismutase family protein [Candidatus Omnitrophota bacterium]